MIGLLPDSSINTSKYVSPINNLIEINIVDSSRIVDDFCDGSRPPSAQGLHLGFEWPFVLGVWSMVLKRHIDKFKDLNLCLRTKWGPPRRSRGGSTGGHPRGSLHGW